MWVPTSVRFDGMSIGMSEFGPGHADLFSIVLPSCEIINEVWY
jgi:hypothetical protein